MALFTYVHVLPSISLVSWNLTPCAMWLFDFFESALQVFVVVSVNLTGAFNKNNYITAALCLVGAIALCWGILVKLKKYNATLANVALYLFLSNATTMSHMVNFYWSKETAVNCDKTLWDRPCFTPTFYSWVDVVGSAVGSHTPHHSFSH